ncbi:tol-pal system YbgF family protein [uncultured Winogradskyella sp.]|uniref:tetratricopeptide repeat protein n=1 Tax=uncultured Winogradskyella sp. TaxID=395353 RepID=UPI0026076C0D|nr:tetratricopeptide repeat protein [uncultured Winogradskyella sp.]
MATYKKRGYKPKTKKEKVEEIEQDSTTAEVFNTLDESASKTEEWVIKNQNFIYGIVGVVAVVILAYMGYNKFIAEPNAKDAMNEMSKAQSYFDEAINATDKDSLLTLSLEGGEGKYGMLDIIDEYGSTPAGNLANYYAGMAYLNMKKYDEAIKHLSDFSSDDLMLSAISKGGIGDAFVQLNQSKDGLEYYEKAIKVNANDYTTPLYLKKAAIVAMGLGENQKALDYLNRVKTEFSKSNEAKDIDVLIGKASASL